MLLLSLLLLSLPPMACVTAYKSGLLCITTAALAAAVTAAAAAPKGLCDADDVGKVRVCSSGLVKVAPHTALAVKDEHAALRGGTAARACVCVCVGGVGRCGGSGRSTCCYDVLTIMAGQQEWSTSSAALWAARPASSSSLATHPCCLAANPRGREGGAGSQQV
jgi:hypothetical protein